MKTWIQITSGQGPSECGRAVYLVTQVLTKWLSAQGLTNRMVNAIPDRDVNCYKSALLVTDADGGRLTEWEGTIQWICSSPFRPTHKRKNWFVGVELFHPPETIAFRPAEVRIETMRASGPGGQHVNTTDSAVRATHVPTGTVATASEERSQARNKALALARLAGQLERQKQDAANAHKRTCWQAHSSLVRGNPVKTFKGPKFREA